MEVKNQILDIFQEFDILCIEINIACTVIWFDSGIETYCKTYLVYYITFIILGF